MAKLTAFLILGVPNYSKLALKPWVAKHSICQCSLAYSILLYVTNTVHDKYSQFSHFKFETLSYSWFKFYFVCRKTFVGVLIFYCMYAILYLSNNGWMKSLHITDRYGLKSLPPKSPDLSLLILWVFKIYYAQPHDVNEL